MKINNEKGWPFHQIFIIISIKKSLEILGMESLEKMIVSPFLRCQNSSESVPCSVLFRNVSERSADESSEMNEKKKYE